MATLKLDIPGLSGGDDPQQQQPAAPPPPPPPLNFAQFASNPMAQAKVSAMIPGLPPPPQQVASAGPPPFTPPKPEAPAPPPPPSGLAPETVQPSASIPTQPTQPANLPTLQDRLSQAAGLQAPPSMAQWQQENPNLQAKPDWTGASTGHKILDILRIAAGGLAGGPLGAMNMVQGLRLHDQPAGLQDIDTQRYQQQVMQPYTAQLGAMETGSKIGEQQSTTALNQGKLTQLPLETEIKREAAEGTLAAHGLKQVTDEQGNTSIAPDEDSPVYQHQQAQTQYIGAQQQLDAARTAYQTAAADAKTNPNNPTLVLRRQALAIAMKNAQTAAGRLGLSTLQYDMRAHGTDATGNALPGAVLGDDDTPVGTAFQQNVRPTGTERNKGDMAQSAHEQIGTLQSIVKQRPDIFGPAAGRKTDFNVWLGSQDPDAQRFRAARTIAGDHLAGTFGGRSEAALSAIDNAIGQFKDNPAAVSAGLDQLDKANNVFLQRGTPRVSNGRGGASGPVGGGKTLDPGTAKTFLQQAGGDKAKARQLAQQAGYRF